jgi:hypothetical protein
MKNCSYKNKLVFVLLVLFTFMKLTGLHAFSHEKDQDHTEDCIACHFANIHYHTPFLSSTTEVVVKKFDAIAVNIPIIYKGNGYLKTIAQGQLFSRPPPFFLLTNCS